MRNANSKRALYESIMRRVGKVVKQAINESEGICYRMTDDEMYDMVEIYQEFDEVDTSAMTNMRAMFYGMKDFNQPLGKKFDTSNVTNMSGMFFEAHKFNQPLGDKFDTSKVENMSYMFSDALAFNQPLGDKFDTRNVTDMTCMFAGARAFDQPLGDKFDTSNVTNMAQMFYKANCFNQPLMFDTSKVKDMSYMFTHAHLFDQPLDHLDVSSLNYINCMFYKSGMSDKHILDFVRRVAETNPRCYHRDVTHKPELQKQIDMIFDNAR